MRFGCFPLTPALRAATVSLGERENLSPLGGEWNALGRSHAHGCFERCFPLTPALSLGERENLPPLGGEWNALGRSRAHG